jgi:hypothetical protein
MDNGISDFQKSEPFRGGKTGNSKSPQASTRIHLPKIPVKLYVPLFAFTRSRAMLIRHFWLATVFGILLSGANPVLTLFLELSYNFVSYPDPIAVCETAASFWEFRDGRR